MKKTVSAPPSAPSPVRPFPRPVIVLLAVLFCLSLAFNLYWLSEKSGPAPLSASPPKATDRLLLINGDRDELINPLRLVDLENESPGLQPVKSKILRLTEERLSRGDISDISVYYRRLNDGSWFSTNGTERYRLGSIAKIPLMMYFLRQAQDRPGLLKKQILHNRPVANPKNETYPGGSMVLGRSYTILELISRMIVESDNVATTLLLQELDKPEEYERIFRVLGLREPTQNDPDYALSAGECSRFLRVLYNATLLNEEYSGLALRLLSKAGFHEGIRKPIPASQPVASKFGEAGDPRQPEFSETGIVYHGDQTYLLTVMTRGKDSKEQAAVISEISQLVYGDSCH